MFRKALELREVGGRAGAGGKEDGEGERSLLSGKHDSDRWVENIGFVSFDSSSGRCRVLVLAFFRTVDTFASA